MSDHERRHAPVSRRTERLLALVAIGLTVVLGVSLAVTRAAPSSYGPDRDAADHMLELINAERSRDGLTSLDASDDIAQTAEAWSQRMAAENHLRHNPDYATEICCWSRVTENVAFSDPHRVWLPGDPVLRITGELHDVLMASDSHRVNILDEHVSEIGIGVHVHEDGSVWITQNFRHPARH